jgi:phospholipase C
MPVVSSLARGFATFDRWFCEVPSQTFTNRSFFHAGTSSGFVVNMAPADVFPVHNTAETIFERLEASDLTWRVYCDPAVVVPFTGLIHAARLHNRFTNFFSTNQFLEDAASGDLPTYSFIEPNLWQGHNDMHPAYNANYPGMSFDPPSSLLGGEAFLAIIYDAIRGSASPRGSNVFNTLLLVAFDEHGGTYDHVPPPLAPPPSRSAGAGQLGFTFERSGVRLPAIAISPWIDERAVVNETFRSTSVLATLRERWSLGKPFSDREAIAPTLQSVLTRDTPREPETWPDVTARPVPPFDEDLIPPDAPLGVLARAIFFGFLAFGKNLGQKVPDYSPDAPPTGAEALAIVRDLFGHLYPNLGL